MKLIDVIPLTKIPLPNHQILTYFTNIVNMKRGSFVMAPLGKRKVPAIVINVKKVEDEKINIKTADYQLSPIREILSAKPVISPKQLELASWIHKYYYEPLGIILKAMLPKNITLISNFKFTTSGQTQNSKSQISKLLQLSLNNSVNHLRKEITKTLKEKKQILILAPEINILNYLQENIIPHSNVGLTMSHIRVLTSKTSQKQFGEIWQKTANGKIKIILGTRKTLFLPFRNLGLIILTEEHSPHYKSSDQHPKYHTRETAKKLAKLFDAKLIMQSEIPSIETKFKDINTPPASPCEAWRASKSQINSKPEIQNSKQRKSFMFHVPCSMNIIDMREEIKARNYSIFSRELLENLKKSVEKKEKIILFINRRGEASAILCRDCGYIIKCKNCETPMVLHAARFKIQDSRFKILICHHCSYKEHAPNLCPNCHGHRIKFLGGGTEKVEEEIKKLIPKIKTIRFEADTIKRLWEKQRLLEEADKENCIIIGTQIINTLDLPQADLVGVVNSDTIFNMPDFRSGERAFQMINRLLNKLKKSGKIIYQTYSPDHYVIKYGLQKDYDNFYKEEVESRKLFKYPPFSQIIKLSFSHRNEDVAKAEAERLREKLSTLNFKLLTITGPAPSFIPRKRGKYVFRIILKFETNDCNIKSTLLSLVPSNWDIDIDPESLL